MKQTFDTTIKQIVEIASQFSAVKKVVLFGSRARGDHTSKSDYDIAVYTDGEFPDKTLFMNRMYNLDTLYKIDIVYMNEKLSPELVRNIEHEGIIIMERQNKVQNYITAVERLREALAVCGEHPESIVRDGIIQRFEFCTELAWKACREYLMGLGFANINAPRTVLQEAFSYGLIEDNETWITILNDRNLTSHIYDEQTAQEIFDRIRKQHAPVLLKLSKEFESLGR